MKHSLLTAALVLGSLAPVAAFAQTATQDAPQTTEHRGMHHDPHRQAMHLGKKLGLSADQTAKLEPILAQHQQQVEGIRQNTSLTPDQRKAQMHDAMHAMHEQLANVLTPDQMNQLREMRKEHRNHDAATPAPSGV